MSKVVEGGEGAHHLPAIAEAQQAEQAMVRAERDALRVGFAMAAKATNYTGDWFESEPIKRLVAERNELQSRYNYCQQWIAGEKMTAEYIEAEAEYMRGRESTIEPEPKDRRGLIN